MNTEKRRQSRSNTLLLSMIAINKKGLSKVFKELHATLKGVNIDSMSISHTSKILRKSHDI